ncbi:MAG: outer membrane protein transport protein [Rikenellaceae bacterium]
MALGVATFANVVSASAEGYQVNTLSAKQLGMAHTGVSQKLNSESLWFNPAGAAHQEEFFTVSAGTTLIAATADWTNGTDSHKTDNPLSTPIYANVNFKIGKNLALGVLFNTPYGSSLNWGSDWAGAHMVQSISLQAYNAQPTISYKMFNDRLSVGAGLMMSWGNFELNKSLISNEQLGAGVAMFGSNPVHGTLGGDAKLALGYNVGLMFDVCDAVTIGASYRSKMMMKVDEGTTAISYSNDAAEAYFGASLNPMTTTTFSAEMPLPAVWSLGVTVRPVESLELSAEAQLTEWSAYKSLNLTMNNEALRPYYDQNMEKSYSNAVAARLGAQYDLGKFMVVRAGVYYDQSPVADNFLNPETPSMDKMGYTAGLSIRPFSKMSIDLSYGFLHGIGGARSGSCDYKMTTGEVSSFSGDYSTKAHMASVGLSFGF